MIKKTEAWLSGWDQKIFQTEAEARMHTRREAVKYLSGLSAEEWEAKLTKGDEFFDRALTFIYENRYGAMRFANAR